VNNFKKSFLKLALFLPPLRPPWNLKGRGFAQSAKKVKTTDDRPTSTGFFWGGLLAFGARCQASVCCYMRWPKSQKLVSRCQDPAVAVPDPPLPPPSPS
jgi:hypothetical protein